MRRAILILAALTLSILGCNLSESASSSSATATPSLAVDNSTRPLVFIDSPANGSQGVIRQQLTLRVRATDTIGITRVNLLEGDRVVLNQPSPDPVTNFEALLNYIPTAVGSVTLKVIAYRGASAASEPAVLTLDIVGSQQELRNPGSLDPTLGVASGSAICTIRINVDNLRLRGGPGTNYKILTTLRLGEDMTVIGRDAQTTWLQGRRQSGQEGWVSAQYVQQNGDCSRAPVIAAPAP